MQACLTTSSHPLGDTNFKDLGGVFELGDRIGVSEHVAVTQAPLSRFEIPFLVAEQVSHRPHKRTDKAACPSVVMDTAHPWIVSGHLSEHDDS